MTELETTAVVFLCLLAATGLGVLVRPLLLEEHKVHETVQLLKLVVSMLVTFAALVLGLLTALSKTVFDTTTADIRTYAAELIQLDNSLREYDPDTDVPRHILRAYTAAAITSTWSQEPPPAGNYYQKTLVWATALIISTAAYWAPPCLNGRNDIPASCSRAMRSTRSSLKKRLAGSTGSSSNTLENRGGGAWFSFVAVRPDSGLLASRHLPLLWPDRAAQRTGDGDDYTRGVIDSVHGARDPRSRHPLHGLHPRAKPAHARRARLPQPLKH